MVTGALDTSLLKTVRVEDGQRTTAAIRDPSQLDEGPRTVYSLIARSPNHVHPNSTPEERRATREMLSKAPTMCPKVAVRSGTKHTGAAYAIGDRPSELWS
jgi:hypothetical protein